MLCASKAHCRHCSRLAPTHKIGNAPLNFIFCQSGKRQCISSRARLNVYSASADNKKSIAGKGFGKAAPDTASKPVKDCPCRSGNLYSDCCQGYHDGKHQAENPETLLRSRFCAYALRIPEYITDTTHPESKEYTGSKKGYTAKILQVQKKGIYSDFEIIEHEQGASTDEASITFQFKFVQSKQADSGSFTPPVEPFIRKEKSTFGKIADKWYFVDGDILK